MVDRLSKVAMLLKDMHLFLVIGLCYVMEIRKE